MDIYAMIKAKHGFEIPAAYRRLEQKGLFDFKNPGTPCDPLDESYLWVPEAEWMGPQEILEYEGPPYQRPGFVPFAFTGAGEPWCWWPEQDPEAVVGLPIACAGVFDAPNFIGSIYRRFIEYAIYVDEGEDEEQARGFFTLWARQLRDDFPAAWIDLLRRLSQADAASWELGEARGRGLLHPTTQDEIISRDLAFPRLNEEFEWTTE
jgi:hypothetical protein